MVKPISISAEEGMMLLEFRKESDLEASLQEFLSEIGIKRAKRKNLYNDLVQSF